MEFRPFILAAAIALAPSSMADAHHSVSMFDNTTEVTISGTITKFDWTNPHIWIQILVPDAKSGMPVEWMIEGPPTNGMARRGWSKHSLKVADKATLILYPLRNGKPGGFVLKGSVDGVPIG